MVDTKPKTREPFRDVLLPLIAEYNTKLTEIGLRADSILDQARNVRKNLNDMPYLDRDWSFLSQRYKAEITRTNKFSGACEQMARRVSQHLEHSNIEEFDRIELELRLGELEANLAWLNSELQAGMSLIASP